LELKPLKHRTAAIRVGEIVGCSAMMERLGDEALTQLAAREGVIERNVASLDGRIFNKVGDATVDEIASPIHALCCAAGIGVELAGPQGGFRGLA
jgi:class 3 adenylate cyclase